MLAHRQRSFWIFIAVTALVATMLGGAYVGFKSGGAAGHRSAASSSATDDASKTSKQNKADHLADSKDADSDATDEDKEDDDDEGWSFHDRLKKFFAEGDESALDGLKPRGITDIEGEGGKGLNRQVKSHGAWYPVFNLAKAKSADPNAADKELDPDEVELNQVPLAIVSPNPPAGSVGQPFSYAFAAVGGAPPYRWTMQLSAASDRFRLDAFTGALSGQSSEAVTATMNVIVTDTEGAQATAAFTLVISPAEPLVITTATLPPMVLDQPYQATLAGEGGVPPYTWALVTTAPLQCDPTTGALSGTATQAGEFSVTISLTDSQQTVVDKTLPLSATAGLEITTESPLLPATPGANYTSTFEAMGGTPPYVWQIAGGSLPDGWTLAATGELSGLADKREGLFHFDVLVTDSNGLDYRKPFDLSVVQPLIVVPSRQCAGLAWQPSTMQRMVTAPIASVIVNRSGPSGRREVYRGTGSNFVDHNLVAGASYDYQLTINTVDGKSVVFGSQRVTILPMTLQRASPGATADPFADRVVAFNPISPGGYGAANLPYNVTGPPDGRSTFTPASLPSQVASLHAMKARGGSITLEFTDNIVELGNGPDLTVFENVMFQNGDPNQRFMEPAVIEVALFEGQWFRFPMNVNPPVTGKPNLMHPAYYAQGFAGVNATTGDDPTDANRSGGDSFDLNALGVSGIAWIRFIRIQSTGDRAMVDGTGNIILHYDAPGLNMLTGKGSSGFDLDAVSAVNY